MGFTKLIFVSFVIGFVSAQNYKVCISSSASSLCQSLDKDGSQASCSSVETNVDCAIRLARGDADIGYFTEEELLLLAQQQPNDNRVVATVRDVNRMEANSFEAVAVVPRNHTGGLEGLRGGRYCHPGLDQGEVRWSPRVLKTFEQSVARTDHCANVDTAGKTAEEIEVETLNGFFSASCRPGTWISNTTIDADLKTRFPSLCSLCGQNPSCSGYTYDMGINIAGVRNENRHIQALECLRTNSNDTAPAVAYVAWLHVREYFNIRNPQDAASYSLLCPDGSLQPLTAEILNSATAPCSFVKQPWGAIVASTSSASTVLTNLQTWWPNGQDPGSNTWQSVLYAALVVSAGGVNARVVFENTLLSPANYTVQFREIPHIDSVATCLPTRRWCTTSNAEHTKCLWIRNAAYTLGIQPYIGCQQRGGVFDCLTDIKENRIDFIATGSNYGYIARQHYQLSAVKLVQNSRSATSRVAAFVKESATANITRFENLRGKKACFPEFGGLAYVAFLRTAQQRSVISSQECDYMKAVGEFFDGACAPGALDASHTLSESTFNASSLCSVCKPISGIASDFICSYDYTNMYYGNNGSLACLADPLTDVAVLNTANINTHLQSLGLQANQFRALCQNNTLAAQPGVNIDDACLLAFVVDAEILARRNDPLNNALSSLFDSLDLYFGYNAATGNQLIKLEIFSPFDGTSDLLFKDSTIGLTEASSASSHEPARNYIELFGHLDACSRATPIPDVATRSLYSVLTMFVMAMLTQFVFY